MTLKGVVRGKRRPPKTTLYGSPGVGKSTFGSDAPKPIFVPTEDGIDNLPVDQFERAKTWQEVLDRVRQIATEDHDYKTIVIDTLNGAVELASQYICNTIFSDQWTAKKGDGGFLAWGQGWKATSEEVRTLLALLDDCRARGMYVLLLAHTGLHNVKHPIEGDYMKFAPDIDKTVWARIAAWSDIVLRADYEYVVVRDKLSARGRAIGTQVRKLISAGSAAEDAKCRAGYELPDTMALSWHDFEEQLGKGGATLEELKELWPLLDKKQAAAAMLWLGADKLEDAPLSRMRQMLDRLRKMKAERLQAETNGNGAETKEEAA